VLRQIKDKGIETHERRLDRLLLLGGLRRFLAAEEQHITAEASGKGNDDDPDDDEKALVALFRLAPFFLTRLHILVYIFSHAASSLYGCSFVFKYHARAISL